MSFRFHVTFILIYLHYNKNILKNISMYLLIKNVVPILLQKLLLKSSLNSRNTFNSAVHFNCSVSIDCLIRLILLKLTRRVSRGIDRRRCHSNPPYTYNALIMPHWLLFTFFCPTRIWRVATLSLVFGTRGTYFISIVR